MESPPDTARAVTPSSSGSSIARAAAAAHAPGPFSPAIATDANESVLDGTGTRMPLTRRRAAEMKGHAHALALDYADHRNSIDASQEEDEANGETDVDGCRCYPGNGPGYFLTLGACRGLVADSMGGVGNPKFLVCSQQATRPAPAAKDRREDGRPDLCTDCIANADQDLRLLPVAGLGLLYNLGDSDDVMAGGSTDFTEIFRANLNAFCASSDACTQAAKALSEPALDGVVTELTKAWRLGQPFDEDVLLDAMTQAASADEPAATGATLSPHPPATDREDTVGSGPRTGLAQALAPTPSPAVAQDRAAVRSGASGHFGNVPAAPLDLNVSSGTATADQGEHLAPDQAAAFAGGLGATGLAPASAPGAASSPLKAAPTPPGDHHLDGTRVAEAVPSSCAGAPGCDVSLAQAPRPHEALAPDGHDSVPTAEGDTAPRVSVLDHLGGMCTSRAFTNFDLGDAQGLTLITGEDARLVTLHTAAELYCALAHDGIVGIDHPTVAPDNWSRVRRAAISVIQESAEIHGVGVGLFTCLVADHIILLVSTADSPAPRPPLRGLLAGSDGLPSEAQWQAVGEERQAGYHSLAGDLAAVIAHALQNTLAESCREQYCFSNRYRLLFELVSHGLRDADANAGPLGDTSVLTAPLMRTVDAAGGRSPGPRTKRILHLVPAIANGASLLCFRELDADPHQWDVCGGERQTPASASTLCLLTQPGLLVDIMYIVGVAGADARNTFERWLHEACREGTPWGSAEHRALLTTFYLELARLEPTHGHLRPAADTQDAGGVRDVSSLADLPGALARIASSLLRRRRPGSKNLTIWQRALTEVQAALATATRRWLNGAMGDTSAHLRGASAQTEQRDSLPPPGRHPPAAIQSPGSTEATIAIAVAGGAATFFCELYMAQELRCLQAGLAGPGDAERVLQPANNTAATHYGIDKGLFDSNGFPCINSQFVQALAVAFCKHAKAMGMFDVDRREWTMEQAARCAGRTVNAVCQKELDTFGDWPAHYFLTLRVWTSFAGGVLMRLCFALHQGGRLSGTQFISLWQSWVSYDGAGSHPDPGAPNARLGHTGLGSVMTDATRALYRVIEGRDDAVEGLAEMPQPDGDAIHGEDWFFPTEQPAHATRSSWLEKVSSESEDIADREHDADEQGYDTSRYDHDAIELVLSTGFAGMVILTEHVLVAGGLTVTLAKMLTAHTVACNAAPEQQMDRLSEVMAHALSAVTWLCGAEDRESAVRTKGAESLASFLCTEALRRLREAASAWGLHPLAESLVPNPESYSPFPEGVRFEGPAHNQLVALFKCLTAAQCLSGSQGEEGLLLGDDLQALALVTDAGAELLARSDPAQTVFITALELRDGRWEHVNAATCAQAGEVLEPLVAAMKTARGLAALRTSADARRGLRPWGGLVDAGAVLRAHGRNDGLWNGTGQAQGYMQEAVTIAFEDDPAGGRAAWAEVLAARAAYRQDCRAGPASAAHSAGTAGRAFGTNGQCGASTAQDSLDADTGPVPSVTFDVADESIPSSAAAATACSPDWDVGGHRPAHAICVEVTATVSGVEYTLQMLDKKQRSIDIVGGVVDRLHPGLQNEQSAIKAHVDMKMREEAGWQSFRFEDVKLSAAFRATPASAPELSTVIYFARVSTASLPALTKAKWVTVEQRRLHYRASLGLDAQRRLDPKAFTFNASLCLRARFPDYGGRGRAPQKLELGADKALAPAQAPSGGTVPLPGLAVHGAQGLYVRPAPALETALIAAAATLGQPPPPVHAWVTTSTSGYTYDPDEARAEAVSANPGAVQQFADAGQAFKWLERQRPPGHQAFYAYCSPSHYGITRRWALSAALTRGVRYGTQRQFGSRAAAQAWLDQERRTLEQAAELQPTHPTAQRGRSRGHIYRDPPTWAMNCHRSEAETAATAAGAGQHQPEPLSSTRPPSAPPAKGTAGVAPSAAAASPAATTMAQELAQARAELAALRRHSELQAHTVTSIVHGSGPPDADHARAKMQMENDMDCPPDGGVAPSQYSPSYPVATPVVLRATVAGHTAPSAVPPKLDAVDGLGVPYNDRSRDEGRSFGGASLSGIEDVSDIAEKRAAALLALHGGGAAAAGGGARPLPGREPIRVGALRCAVSQAAIETAKDTYPLADPTPVLLHLDPNSSVAVLVEQLGVPIAGILGIADQAAGNTALVCVEATDERSNDEALIDALCGKKTTRNRINASAGINQWKYFLECVLVGPDSARMATHIALCEKASALAQSTVTTVLANTYGWTEEDSHTGLACQYYEHSYGFMVAFVNTLTAWRRAGCSPALVHSCARLICSTLVNTVMTTPFPQEAKAIVRASVRLARQMDYLLKLNFRIPSVVKERGTQLALSNATAINELQDHNRTIERRLESLQAEGQANRHLGRDVADARALAKEAAAAARLAGADVKAQLLRPAAALQAPRDLARRQLAPAPAPAPAPARAPAPAPAPAPQPKPRAGGDGDKKPRLGDEEYRKLMREKDAVNAREQAALAQQMGGFSDEKRVELEAALIAKRNAAADAARAKRAAK